MSERDGFSIRDFQGNEVHFVPCTDNSDRMRERVLMGLLRNMNTDQYFVADARDEASE